MPAHAQGRGKTLGKQAREEREETSQENWRIRIVIYPLSHLIRSSGPLIPGPNEHLLRKLIR